MSVVFTTNRGYFVVDLFLRVTPKLGYNFIKLCKLGYFNNSIFYEVVQGFVVKLGHIQDKDGTTIDTLISGNTCYIEDEICSKLSHCTPGLLSTANKEPNANTSAFFITLGTNLHRLDGKHSIFGRVAEHFDIISGLQKELRDRDDRPLTNIRIRKTEIIYDPFPDPEGFQSIRFTQYPIIKEKERLEDDELLNSETSLEFKERMNKLKARKNAEILEILGDIPSSDIAPDERKLFVCKLNPGTNEDSLSVVFSRFGQIEDIKVVRSSITKRSKCYGFITFKEKSSAEEAYLKLQDSIVDGKRIHVDFCQSTFRNNLNVK